MTDAPELVWVAAGTEAPAEGRLVYLELEGRPLLVCRARGGLYALADRCPHTGARLEGARLEGTVLECPLHGGRLDVRDGSPVELPIRRPAERFDVREGARGLEIRLPRRSQGCARPGGDTPCTTS
jgi:naphthalene 1,2-dioxygenase system ferredoxin subunit